MERFHVERVLEGTQWHRGKACEILGISRQKSQQMIKKWTDPTGSNQD
ncbi:helix-turn-helix domain-containing protein [Neptunomonas japonica]|nr:helix-turn-helix domain-containing protein [Neptunomonas japonica]